MTTDKPKKIEPGSIKIELFGDLLRMVKASPQAHLPVKKYQDFSEAVSSKNREDRILLYKFLCGLALTAHARRTAQEAPRKVIYDVKNELFLSIVNNFANRKVLNFRMCVSPRFKVVEYCEFCKKSNTEANLDAREWKFCKKCKVDRSYYNVVSVYHRFPEGGVALFLGQDLLEKVFPIKELKKVPMGKFKEELIFGNFHFSAKNLHSVSLDSLLNVAEKLLKLAPATLTVDPERMRKNSHGLQDSRPVGKGKPFGAASSRGDRVARNPRNARVPSDSRGPRRPVRSAGPSGSRAYPHTQSSAGGYRNASQPANGFKGPGSRTDHEVSQAPVSPLTPVSSVSPSSQKEMAERQNSGAVVSEPRKTSGDSF